MSAFLGKIHYWLYNKIKIQEDLIKNILEKGREKDSSLEKIIREKSYELYGKPLEGDLEDLIDHSNIHGWLQERIENVEYRLAFIVTEILKEKVLSLEDIKEIFKEKGKEVVNNRDIVNLKPEELYKLIFDYVIEGMPCDRINKIIKNNHREILWEKTVSIHDKFWNDIGGDIKNFYILREAFIDGILSYLNYKGSYGSEGEDIFYIRIE